MTPKSAKIGCASLCVLQYFAQMFGNIGNAFIHSHEGHMNVRDAGEHGEGQQPNSVEKGCAGLCMCQYFVQTFTVFGNTLIYNC